MAILEKVFEEARPNGEFTSLIVGCGSCINTAMVYEATGGAVSAIDVIPAVVNLGRENLRKYYKGGVPSKIKVYVDDATNLQHTTGTFDFISVDAGSETAPVNLLNLLKDGGTLVVPQGSAASMLMQIYKRRGTSFEVKTGISVNFVPLLPSRIANAQ